MKVDISEIGGAYQVFVAEDCVTQQLNHAVNVRSFFRLSTDELLEKRVKETVLAP